MRPAYKEGLWPWLFQRITAVVLAAGLLLHFIVVHFATKRPLSFDQIRQRLATPTWAIIDGVLLLCAIYHGLNGLMGIVNDFNPRPETRRLASGLLGVIGMLTFAYGIYVLGHTVYAAQYLALKQ
jgi:succinate dehydrogenase hydrophobic membrane anchor protein